MQLDLQYVQKTAECLTRNQVRAIKICVHTHTHMLTLLEPSLGPLLPHDTKGLSPVLRACLVSHDNQDASVDCLVFMCKLLRHAPEHCPVVMDIIGLSEGTVALVL